MSPPQEDESVLSCAKCGSTVYQEQLASQRAVLIAGEVVCWHCRQDTAPDEVPDAEEAPLDLVEEVDDDDGGASQIRAFGAGVERHVHFKEEGYQRPLLKDSPFATRCRTFHAKLTDAAVTNLNGMINDWVDAHEEVQIKFAETVVGIVEGKAHEPHLIITVFY